MDIVKNRPLVIFIHGRGFRNNNKSSSISNKLGKRLGEKGYVVASIDNHEVMFPAQQDGLPKTELYINDKLHYNTQGYQVWGNTIRDQVKTILNYK